ncbi:MAG: sialate O-acetylesterase, partial [bacterium]
MNKQLLAWPLCLRFVLAISGLFWHACPGGASLADETIDTADCVTTDRDEKPAGDGKTLRVFIFAGQSNMVGSHSRVVDIKRFPPFAGLDKPQANVLFSYKIGREQMLTSDGWTALQPTTDYFGPELSFGKIVSQNVEDPIAIIKIASGGTTLGEDWNPDQPGGFKLYPLALEHIRKSLAELDRKQVAYRLEGFMWHQGENDMFSKVFKPIYAENLKNFIASWRRDLNAPQLRFYIGELCTKTIWG